MFPGLVLKQNEFQTEVIFKSLSLKVASFSTNPEPLSKKDQGTLESVVP
jgi:hypothetical protein